MTEYRCVVRLQERHARLRLEAPSITQAAAQVRSRYPDHRGYVITEAQP